MARSPVKVTPEKFPLVSRTLEALPPRHVVVSDVTLAQRTKSPTRERGWLDEEFVSLCSHLSDLWDFPKYKTRSWLIPKPPEFKYTNMFVYAHACACTHIYRHRHTYTHSCWSLKLTHVHKHIHTKSIPTPESSCLLHPNWVSIAVQCHWLWELVWTLWVEWPQSCLAAQNRETQSARETHASVRGTSNSEAKLLHPISERPQKPISEDAKTLLRWGQGVGFYNTARMRFWII